MNEKRTVNQRKTFFIDPPLQKRIILTFLILGLSMVMLNMLVFALFANRLMSYVQSNNVSPDIFNFIQESWQIMSLLSAGASILVVVGFVVYGVIYSNRIAGPIYRIRQAINQVLNDDPNVHFNFRKDDYFQDLSEKMEQLIEKLKKRN